MTQPRYVYLLSQRGEHGADHITSTLDRRCVPALLAANWHGPDFATAVQTVGRLLGFRDEDLAQGIGHQLTPGQRSLQLHVVRLA
jgi:hypothetical protein